MLAIVKTLRHHRPAPGAALSPPCRQRSLVVAARGDGIAPGVMSEASGVGFIETKNRCTFDGAAGSLPGQGQ